MHHLVEFKPSHTTKANNIDIAVIRAQKNIFIQREAEAAAEAEEERRTMARQGARRTRPPNRPSGPSYGGSSSRNPRPQAEDREYQDWVQQQHSQSSAQVQPEADPTRNSSPYSAHPGYYADGSSTQSRIQEADTTQTSIYSNPQDAYSYQQNPPDSPELAFDQQSGSYYRVPPPRSSRHQKIEEEPRYTSHGVYAQGYPQGQDARDPYAQNQYAQGYPAAQDPRGQPNPPYGYDDHYDTSRTGRGRR